MQFLQQSCFIVLFNQCLSANKVQKIAAKFNLKILIVDRGKVGGDSKNLQIKMKQTHKKGTPLYIFLQSQTSKHPYPKFAKQPLRRTTLPEQTATLNASIPILKNVQD